MAVRVGINGFGRIGRNILRAIVEQGRRDIEVVAINDLGPVETNAHLLQFDSVHGRFPRAVRSGADWIDAGTGPIRVTAERDPAALPWRDVDVALECTGVFTARDKAALHLGNGARRVLVSAGPTRAYLDPVRFFTNASTGAMGFALAEMAAQRGAEVTLVAGPVEQPTPPGVARVNVETAGEMLSAMDAVLARAPVDLVAMVAAVSDVASARPSTAKLPKQDLFVALGAHAWAPAVDVLRTLVERHHQRAYFLGFGAQTVDSDEPARIDAALQTAGRQKLESKGCDAIFVNRVGAPGTGFSSDTNAGLLMVRTQGDPLVVASGTPVPKSELAGWLLDHLAERAPVRARPSGGEASA